MTLSKNAQDRNQQPQNAAAIANTIGVTTFMVHPLSIEKRWTKDKHTERQKEKWNTDKNKKRQKGKRKKKLKKGKRKKN